MDNGRIFRSRLTRRGHRPPVPGPLHHAPAPAAGRRRGDWPLWITVLYGLAVALAVYGVVRVILDFSGASLGYLAGLVGIFMAAGAAIQQVEKQREERRQGRLQAEHDSLRRFDVRFTGVTHTLATGTPGEQAGAAAALMSFLREENAAYHRQTYYYLLAHLKSQARNRTLDSIIRPVFECAAHLVLPSLAAVPPSQASTARRSGWLRPAPAGEADARQAPRERRLAVDLTGAALAGVDLAFLELSEADLSGTVLRAAQLPGSCLWRARGRHTDLSGASLRHANLEEAVLLELSAAGADFSDANLVAARFAPRGSRSGCPVKGADLRGAQFVRARLQGACLNGTDLRDARFDGANLKGASFYGALLNEAALLTVLRSVHGSWRKARWEPAAERALNGLFNRGQGKKRVASPRRRAADIPAMDYRRHPYPRHEDPPRRIRAA